MDPILRRQHPPAFKAKVAWEALKDDKTMAELSSQFGVHPTQIKQWRQILEQGMPGLFTNKHNTDIPIATQAELLGISRSSVYYQPVPVDLHDLNIMNRIDGIYT